jgi:cytochrome b
MTGVRIWDAPTRLFHWTLVALIAFSWWSAKQEQFDWHIWSGIAVLTLIVFRLLWGFFGSSTARFSSFVRGPKTVLAYLRDPKSWRSAGHTPLGALGAMTLLGLIALQVGLGLFSTDEDGFYEGPLAHLVSIDTSDWARDLHEDAFNILLAFIAVHIAAIIFYRLRGKALTKPMITGKALLEPGVEPMRGSRWWVAPICLAVAIVITRWVVAGAPPF